MTEEWFALYLHTQGSAVETVVCFLSSPQERQEDALKHRQLEHAYKNERDLFIEFARNTQEASFIYRWPVNSAVLEEVHQRH